MDVPECKELKKKYDDCFGNWFQNVRKVEPIQCENVFQVMINISSKVCLNHLY